MPRARVRDEDRQRARKACIPCKTSKIRCNAETPCQNCMKRDCKTSCRYIEPHVSQKQSQRPSGATPAVQARLRPQPRPTPTASTATASVLPVVCDGSVPGDDHNDVQTREPAHTGCRDGPMATSPEVTHSRMLLSSKGEKVYIGRIASLSLLQFLRQAVRQYVGPCSFSETASKNVMLEAEVRVGDRNTLGREDILQQQALIQYFFTASAGLLDIFTDAEVFRSLSKSIGSSRVDSDQLLSDERAALYLIIAIGAQCRGHQPHDLQYAELFFARGRTLAFEGMLSDPSVDMTRVFLLLAFYMLGACRRNAAFMYLGVASKAACALGLHSKSHYANLSREERALRQRVWKSLYVLDTLVNSILGRPSTLPIMVPVQDGDDQRDNVLAIDAAYGACTHIASMVSAIATGAGEHDTLTEEFLAKLARWGEKVLPSQRSLLDTSPSDMTDTETVIGNTHVACMYYFAIILVTRPFLLSHLAFKLRTRQANDDGKRPPKPSEDSRIPQLAQVCLDAANYMAQLCHKVMRSNSLASNMCILKAFMFAASLLLGFSLFVDGKASESEAGFRYTKAVLQKFSDLSPQARHYCEILNDFEDAITQYQQKLLEKRRQSTNQYVRQLFSIENDQSDVSIESNPASTRTHALHDLSDPPSYRTDSFDTAALDLMGGTGTGTGTGTNGSLSDISTTGLLPIDDAMNMPLLWDNFNFDWPQPESLGYGFVDDI